MTKETVSLKLMNENREASPKNRNPNVTDDGTDYDPHLHRQNEKPTTNMETLVHLIKCSLGTGILAMPQAFARAGLLVGVLGTFLLGYLITYCLKALVLSQYELCKRERVPLLEYPKSMMIGLAQGPKAIRPLSKIAPALVDTFIVTYQLGVGCVYIVFIAKSVKSMVDPYYEIPITVHMLIMLLPLILLSCIRSLKRLAPFSVVANIIIVVGLAGLTYYLVTLPAVKEDIVLAGNPMDYPLFVGTTLFALTAVGVVVALENNMKTPKSFYTTFGVMNVGMSFVVLLYVFIGALGYLMCRSKCDDSILINAHSDWISVAFVVAVIISYALQCYVPVDIVWRGYVKPRLEKRGVTKMLLAEYILRISMCLLTFVLAVAIPRLGLFISLFGTLCLSVLGIVFPAILQACVIYIQGRNWGCARWKQGRAYILVILGMAALIIGTYTTILAFIDSFKPTPAAAEADSL